MAAPISLSLPQYVDANGTPYNGAVLKAYAAGTTTNILMYTDVGAGTSFTDIALNASGYPQYSGSMVIPHVSENYKLALYATQTAANNNTPAIWAVDGLIPLTISGTFVTNDAVSNASTNVLSVTHTTTGTPVNGIGVGQSFSTETSNGNTELGMVLETVVTDVTAGSEDFDFVVKLMAGGSAAAEKFRVKSTGLIDINGAVQIDGTLTVGVDDTGYDVKFFGATSGNYMLWDESADSLLVNGDIDMVTNGNRIDLDTDNDTSIRASADDTITIEVGGSDLIALTTTSTFSCPVTVGVDDTGHDVKFFGATSGAYMLWDESADDLKLVGAAGFTVAGDIDVDGTTNLDVVDIDGAVDMATTLAVAGNVDFNGDLDVDGTTNLDVVDIDGAVNIATTALVTGVLTTTATQVATGGITSGSDIISDTDSTDSLGSTGVRWLKGWFDTLTAGTLTIGSGSIDDTSGSLALGSTNLTGVGTIGSGVITSTGDVIAGSDLISGDTIAWTGDTNTYFDHPSADTIRVITGGAVSATFNSSQGLVVAGILSTTSAGTSNFRAGVNAGNSIQSGGNYNVAVGDEAGTAITTGDNNVMIGYSAGLLVNTAEDCTIVGSLAGDAATTASGITLVGNKAGGGLTTGGDNTAIGKQALKVATEGTGNTAVGKDALEATTTSSNNTAVGKFALTLNTEGTGNTAIGVNSGKALLTGVNNSFVGNEVGYNLTTGDANVYIGYNNTASAVGVDNELLIGTNANGGGTNTIKLQTTGGSATLGLDGSDTSWAAASDSRLKKDVADSTVGLSFVNDLRPITFKWQNKDKVAVDLPQYDADSSDPIFGEGKSHHGFIAQEVKAVIDSHSDVLDGNNIWHEDPNGTQQLAQGNLVPMLVKAVQELSAEIEALKAKK